MNTLDLYKSRKHSLIRVADGKEYKIPNEYTVEEVERLLELRDKQERKEKEFVENEVEQLQSYWKLVFDQLEIIFGHYQPEIDANYLRQNITHKEALGILGFFRDNKYFIPKDIKEEAEKSDTKKKL